MQTYDAVIIGAGPAGGQCARTLSELGRKVLLVEKLDSFSKNNFSSGGIPLATLTDYQLPESTVGSYWNRVVVGTPKKLYSWKSEKNLGAILEFSALRSFLADEAIAKGAELKMKCQYLSHQKNGNQIETTFLDQGNKTRVQSAFLIDATGPDRAVMAPEFKKSKKILRGVGIEWLVEVDEKKYLSDSLYFFLGKKWVPGGYSWIFSMGKNRLKVGAAQFYIKPRKKSQPLVPSVEKLLSEIIQTSEYKTLDRHGGVFRYYLGQKDQFADGPIVALGDAVSAINPLGGEGIRHALETGRVAAKNIHSALSTKKFFVLEYEPQMRTYFGKKWDTCEKLSIFTYIWAPDFMIHWLIYYCSIRYPTLETLCTKLFDYEFSKHGYNAFTRMVCALNPMALRR